MRIARLGPAGRTREHRTPAAAASFNCVCQAEVQVFGTNTPGIRYAHRDPNGDPEKLKKYVGDVVNELIALEQSTNPAGGKETSKDKDYDASRALEIVGKLVESLAGWAIDHQIGLGIEERYSVHLSSIAIEQHPELLPAVAAVNDHRHEAAGSRASMRATKSSSFCFPRRPSDAG